VRLGPGDGFTAPPEVAQAIFERQLRGEAAKPQAIYLQNGPFPALEAWAREQDIPVVTEAKALEPLGLRPPRVLAHGELAYDLRRDPQLARTRLHSTLAAWRWPVLIGLIAAGVWVTATMIEISRRETQIAALRGQTETLVRIGRKEYDRRQGKGRR
jgi:general secretion pathway protein L